MTNKKHLIAGLLMLLTSIVTAHPSPSDCSAQPCSQDIVASRITKENRFQHRVGGDKAWGGINDWFISNGVLCAIVSDPSHESDGIDSGGYLTDLGYCGRNDDRFLNLFPAINLEANGVIPITQVHTQYTEQQASIITQGALPGLSFTSIYTLSHQAPDYLTLQSTLTRTHEGNAVFAVNWAVMTAHSSRVFNLSLDRLSYSRGFQHPPPLTGLFTAQETFSGSNLLVYLPEGDSNNAISYAQEVVSVYTENKAGEKTELTPFVFNTQNYAGLTAFTNDFWINTEKNSLSVLKLLQSQMMDLAVGHSLTIEQRIWVGDQYQVSSITDKLWSTGPLVSGIITSDEADGEPNTSIHIFDENGSAISQTYSDTNGHFSFHVPTTGQYQLTIIAPAREEVTQRVNVNKAIVSMEAIGVSAPARLYLPQQQIMRLTFIGINQTPDPQINDDNLNYQFSNESPAYSRDIMLAGITSDPEYVILPPGQYRVIASRGPEYSIHSQEISLRSGDKKNLALTTPERILSTPSFVAADMHVHSAPSFDTGLPVSQRIKSYLAQGGEVLVATEHETIYDFSQDINQLGLSDLLATVTGTELTGLVSTEVAPHTIGHANVFPLKVQPSQYRKGQPAHEGRRWRDVIATIKNHSAHTVIQLNHARYHLDSDSPHEPGSLHYDESYLQHLGHVGESYDADKRLSEWPNSELVSVSPDTGFRDIDFDAIELLNGTALGLDAYKALRRDWFSLLRQGIKLTATANSDSHSMNKGEIVLEPRTMVDMSSDTHQHYNDRFNAKTFNQRVFIDAIKNGRVYGTSGPMLEFNLNGAQMGDLLTLNADQNAVLTVTVKTVPWITINELRVYINGELHKTLPINANKTLRLPLTFHKDAFVTIEVQGPREGIYAELIPGLPPFAFSNPIYVDANADKQWDAPLH